MHSIKLKYQNQSLSINPIGGGIMEYYIVDKGKRRDLIYGYKNVETKGGLSREALPPQGKVGSMGDVLFPFPGRVENSRYQFAGNEYQLSNVKIKDGNAIHGFVKDKEWQIEKQNQKSVKLSYTLNAEEYKDSGFPFSLKITLTYSLSNNGLTCQSEVENFGKSLAPFGLGFHPYFTVGGDDIDEMILNINAGKLVEFDSGLKPTGNLLDVSGSDLDFNQPKKIGDRIIDNCYFDLNFVKKVEGAELYHPSGGRIFETVISNGDDFEIIIWQDESFPYLQVYSADTIGETHRRKGFAVEPQTCTGFAFNIPEMGLKVLHPGEKFEGVWGVKASY